MSVPRALVNLPAKSLCRRQPSLNCSCEQLHDLAGKPLDGEARKFLTDIDPSTAEAIRAAVASAIQRRATLSISYEPTGPADPIFYLRRPGGAAAHIWRLFRTRPEARVYMAEYYGRDSEGRDWAEALPAETFEDLLARHGRKS